MGWRGGFPPPFLVGCYHGRHVTQMPAVLNICKDGTERPLPLACNKTHVTFPACVPPPNARNRHEHYRNVQERKDTEY